MKPAALGVIGRDHLEQRFEELGCEMETFRYRKEIANKDGLPEVLETAFACRDFDETADRRLITGVNWSAGIINPFRQLGRTGQSLDSVLEESRAGDDEPVVMLFYLACPCVSYTDRGKSAVVLSGAGGGEHDKDGEL